MRRPSSVAGLLVVLACVLGLLPGVAAPVAARAATTEAATVARSLERSPFYATGPYADAISTAAQRRIERAARAAPGNVRVIFVPLLKGDRYDGDGRNLVTAVRSRLPPAEQEGTFLTIGTSEYLRVYPYRNGEPVYDGPEDDAEYLANYVDDTDGRSYDRTLVQKTERFFRELRRPTRELAQRAVAGRKRNKERAESYESGSSARTGGSDGGTPGVVLLLAALVVLLAVVAAVLVRRSRRGARAADAPLPVLPDRVFAHARAAQRADLAEDADRELLAVAQLLDESPVPREPAAQDAYQRALDAYTGARRRMRDGAPVVDLVGVLVLVDHARDDLARAAAIDAGRKPPSRRALCFFDPLHGRHVSRVAWNDLTVPACAACAAAVRSGGSPDPLRDGERPYFEADTVWARTGYGAFADDLVERVTRGED